MTQIDKSFNRITANHEVIYPRYDPQKFVGRQWLVDEVAQFVEKPESRHLILVGEPGFGKSTFLAYLAETWNCPRHFIRADNIRGVTGIDPRAFLLSLGTQLFQKYGDEIFESSSGGTTKVTVGLSKGQAEVVGRVVEELHTPLPFLKQERDIDVKVGAALGNSKVIGERIVKLVNNSLSLPVSALLHIAVLQPLKNLAELYPEEKVIILIDALDEATQHPEPNILDVIPRANDPDYPENLRLVMTSRHGDHLVAFREEDQRILDDKKSKYWDETIKDTRKYIESRINKDNLNETLSDIPKEEVDSLFADIEKKSDGNFLYLYHYMNSFAEAIKSGITNLDEIPVPDDLDEIYRFFAVDKIRRAPPDQIRFSVDGEITPEIRRSLEHIKNIHGAEINDQLVILAAQDGNTVLGELFSIVSETGLRIIDPEVVLGQDMGAWEEKVLPVLGILAVAFDVLSREQLSSLTKVDVVYVDSILKNLIQFLDTIKIDTRNGYRIYHIDFAEYLLDKDRNRDFPIDESRWHSQIADHYRLEFRNRWNECDEYGLDYTLNHLLNTDMPLDTLEKAVSGLLTEGFINARVTRSGWHQPLVKDLYRLKDRLPLVVYEPCITILGGSHRNSLVNQEVLRLLIEVYRLAPYPPSPYSGSRAGSKDYIIETLLEAAVHHPRRAMLVLESLMEETADVQMKGVIALAMAETGDPSATEKLLDILFNAPEYVSKSTHSGHLRWCAADGLIALNEPESISPLLNKFWEPRVSPWLRQQILYVLGRMQAPLPLEEKYRIIDTGLTLRQDCLPRVLDAVYLLAPSNGSSRTEWSQRYQPIILAGLGVVKAPEGIIVKHWTNPITIKRALTALGRIGNENALTPLDNFIEPMHKREKEGWLNDQEKRLLEAARRARKEILRQWGS